MLVQVAVLKERIALPHHVTQPILLTFVDLDVDEEILATFVVVDTVPGDGRLLVALAAVESDYPLLV